MTDLLEFSFTRFAWRAPKVKEVLARLLEQMQTDRIVDLCSGSSGPLAWFRAEIEKERGRPVNVTLTDKFPNLEAFERQRAASGGRIDFRASSVDATAVPDDLGGVRTLFLAFHHFPPDVAQGILADAAGKRQAIAVFEATERSWRALLLALTIPIIVLFTTPLVRPVRLGRLFWTYLLPVIPLAVWWDGVVSCLRAYTPADLKEMTARVGAADYAWEIGQAPVEGMFARFTYLAGYPRA